jgi:hypothetical protein
MIPLNLRYVVVRSLHATLVLISRMHDPALLCDLCYLITAPKRVIDQLLLHWQTGDKGILGGSASSVYPFVFANILLFAG